MEWAYGEDEPREREWHPQAVNANRVYAKALANGYAQKNPELVYRVRCYIPLEERIDG